MAVYRLSNRFRHKRAFITGGGSGLGRDFCIALAGDGWTIGIADIQPSGLEATAKQVELAGGKAITYLFDVANKEDFKTAFDDFIKQNAGIDLLINNAGVGDSGLLGTYDLDNWKWIIDINLMATIYGTHYAVPVMKEQGFGQIIAISSAAGFVNMPNMSMYNTSKASVISLMETLYAELYSSGVKVSVACPVFFKSNIMQYRKGDPITGAIADAISKRAKITSAVIAKRILNDAGNGTFLILPSGRAKIAFHVSRLFPNFFLDYKAKKFSGKDGLDWLRKVLES